MSGGRLCPRCSTLIESGSAIFCYNCGQELLSSAAPTEPADEILPEKKISPSQRPSPFQLFLIIFTFCLSLGLLFFFFLWRFNNGRPRGPVLKPTANDFVSTISALPQAPVNFGKEAYPALTPATADLYLEGGSLKNFLLKFLDGQSQKRLENHLGLTLEEAISFSEPSFAFIKSASASALLTRSRDLEFVKSRLSKLQEGPALENLQVDLVGDVLVVTDSATFLRDIRQTSQKSQLSLSMTAGFLETSKKLPREGQLFIYSSNLENVFRVLKIFFGPGLESAVGSLRGTAFVVSNRSGSVVLEGIHDGTEIAH